jgi:hypothetical protein
MNGESSAALFILFYNVTLFRPSVPLSFRHSQFPFSILVTVAHIQLKFDTWIRQKNAQVKFEIGCGLITFGRIMPLSF